MPDRIVDRTPNWDNWPPERWVTCSQGACLSMDLDPENPPVELLPRGPFVRSYLDSEGRSIVCPRPPVPPDWRFDLAREFWARRDQLFSNLYVRADGRAFRLRQVREVAAFVARTKWGAPPKLLAMADEQLAKRTDGPRGGKRTDAATSALRAKKVDRLEDLTRFIEDVYEAANRDVFRLGTGNDREALPFSRRELRAVFQEHYPKHDVAQATFDDDLHKISVKCKPAPKRMDIRYLRKMLAKKDLG